MKYYLLLFALFLGLKISYSQTYSTEDLKTLKKIYNNTGQQLNWTGNTTAAYATWEGISWTDIYTDNNLRVTSLKLDNKSLSGVLDIDSLDELVSLHARLNSFTEVSLKRLKKLDTIKIDSVSTLTKIKFDSLHQLQYLSLQNNSLKTIDFKETPNLNLLYVRNNQLENVTGVDSLKAIKVLDFVNNKISDTLDLSQLNTVQSISLYENKLKHVILPKTPTLTDVELAHNEIKTIDYASIDSNLKNLSFHNNDVSKLAISHLTNLEALACNDNHLPISELKNIFTISSNNKWIDSYGYDRLFYFSQTNVLDEKQVLIDEELNLIDEDLVSLNGNHYSSYTWKKMDGTILVEGTDYTKNSYIFKFHTTGDFYCEMYNTAFDKDGFILLVKTKTISVRKASQVNSFPTIPIMLKGDSLPKLTNGNAVTLGKFIYNEPDIILGVGGHQVDVSFIPDTTSKYAKAIQKVTATVKDTTTIIQWPSLSNITYGDSIGKSTLIGGSGVSVTGSYLFDNPSLKPNSGLHLVDVSFAPQDVNRITLYNKSNLMVEKANPIITDWPTLNDIRYGDKLSSNNLINGINTTSGAFKLEAEDLILSPAGQHDLKVNFIPTDTNYHIKNQMISIYVHKKIPHINKIPTASTIHAGQALSEVQLINGSASTDGIFKFKDPTKALTLGIHNPDLLFTPKDTANYTTVEMTINMVINKFGSIINKWPSDKSIYFDYNRKLSDILLNDGLSITSGSFQFENPNKQLVAGTSTEKIIFTPIDTSKYTIQTNTIQVTVNKYSQQINFAQSNLDPKVGDKKTMNALSTSGLSVRLTAIPADMVSIDGITITALKQGAVTIRFHQDGNDKFKAAPNVSTILNIGAKVLSTQLKRGTLNISPNPSKGQIKINGLRTGKTIQLFNNTGKLILEKNVRSESETLNLENIKPGLYLLVHQEKSMRFQIE